MQVFTGFGTMVDGMSTMVNGLIPGVTTIEDNRNKEIISGLLNSGFDKQALLDLINVDVSEATAYIDLRVEVMAEVAKEKEAEAKLKPRAKPRAKTAA